MGILLLLSCTAGKKFQLPEVLREVSGVAPDGKGGWYWHNDSGHPPVLYQTDREGKLLDSIRPTQAVNRDWEDLAADPSGYLYIADVGNNSNKRRDLTIYRSNAATGQLDSMQILYQRQKVYPPDDRRLWQFDAEALAVSGEELWLFTKSFPTGGHPYAYVYRFDFEPGTAAILPIDSIYLGKYIATGAALHPDGQTLALLTYRLHRLFGKLPYLTTRINTFSMREHSLQPLGKRQIHHVLTWRQFEAVEWWDAQRLLIASERLRRFRQTAKVVKAPGVRHRSIPAK